MEIKPKRKIVRQSGSCFSETTIEKELFGEEMEFVNESYTKSPGTEDKKGNLSLLTVCKSGVGIVVKIETFTEKRKMTRSQQLGLDELNILLEYIEQIKPTIKNFAGSVIEDTSTP